MVALLLWVFHLLLKCNKRQCRKELWGFNRKWRKSNLILIRPVKGDYKDCNKHSWNKH